jgi:hypothetical protein
VPKQVFGALCVRSPLMLRVPLLFSTPVPPWFSTAPFTVMSTPVAVESSAPLLVSSCACMLSGMNQGRRRRMRMTIELKVFMIDQAL